MFVGIIKYQSKVLELKEKKDVLTLLFSTPKNIRLEKGKSLSINGICSTVKKFSKNNFEIDYMPETREKTTVNNWKKEDLVNLEESANIKTFLDGHIVQGHIDAIGKIKETAKKGDSRILIIKVPKKYMKFISLKGSVAVDGVSLTVTDTKKDNFKVALIPYSLKHTNLRKLKKGDEVNIETDVLARYLYNLIKHKS